MNMVTISGQSFDLTAPTFDDVKIEDIAHALSHICRFAGHTKEFYSVAEHSVAVAVYLRDNGCSPRLQMLGLLHDAHEAYTNDIPTPVKLKLTGVDAVENALQSQINAKYVGSQPTKDEWAVIADADKRLLHTEAICLQGAGWANPAFRVHEDLHCWLPLQARYQFIKAFKAISEEMRRCED